MQTETTDARAVDAGPLDSHALTVAAGYLVRSASHMGEAESSAASGDAEAVAFHCEISKRLARHALAIVLGEKTVDDHP